MIQPEDQRKVSYLMGFVKGMMLGLQHMGFKQEDVDEELGAMAVMSTIKRMCPHLELDDDELMDTFGHLPDIDIADEFVTSLRRMKRK